MIVLFKGVAQQFVHPGVIASAPAANCVIQLHIEHDSSNIDRNNIFVLKTSLTCLNNSLVGFKLLYLGLRSSTMSDKFESTGRKIHRDGDTL